MLKATSVPGKYTNQLNKWASNLQTICIKPEYDIYLDGPPDNFELCCIVWTPRGRLVKFINRACPIHGKVPCLTQLAY